MTSSRHDRIRPTLPRGACGLAFVVAMLAGATPVAAQGDDVRVTMIASSETPDVGETFQLQLDARVSGNVVGGTLVPPAFGNLRVVGTTGEMRSQSMHQVFGSRPVIESRTVVGYMLVADRPGAYTITGATYRYGRRTATADALVIKVGGTSTPPAAAPALTAENEAYQFDRDVFLRATVDRTEPYVGQQVTYTLYLYTRIDGEPTITRRATTDGFWMHGLLPPQRQLTPDYQTVRGNNYRVYVIDRVALFPERAGPLEIGGAAIDVEVGGVVGRMMGRVETIRRECPPLRVTPKPLPSGAPRGSIVGSATLRAELDRTSVTTGEAATLTITVVADSTLRDATISLPAIDGLRVEPPTIEDRIDAPGDLVGGTRRIRYQLVALRPGTFVIPAFSLTTVVPETGALEHPSSEPIVLVASGAPIDDAPVAVADDEAADEEPTDEALAFGPARRHAEMRRRRLPIHAQAFYLPLLVAPLVGLAVLLSGGRLRDSLERRRAGAGERSRRARKPLADAKKARSNGDPSAFYAAIAGAIHVAIERRTGALAQGMTHAEIRAHLLAAGFEVELVDRIVDELDGADFARFGATAATKDELDRALDRTQALIDRIERTKASGGDA